MGRVETLSDLDSEPHANAFPGSEPRTIRLSLDAGECVDPHRHPGRDVVFYLVEGAVNLRLDDETYELAGGDIARFDGEREISPAATEPSTALVVLAVRPDD